MSLKNLGWAQQHPTKTLIDPDEGPVEIDLQMVPLVEGLWAAKFTTLMSCQDIGESILTGGANYDEAVRPRAGAFYMGMAWLKVPADQGPTLMRVWEPLSSRRRGEWLAQIPVSAGQVCTWASIHFPREQITEAADLLARL